jgi:hypothetical protein
MKAYLVNAPDVSEGYFTKVSTYLQMRKVIEEGKISVLNTDGGIFKIIVYLEKPNKSNYDAEDALYAFICRWIDRTKDYAKYKEGSAWEQLLQRLRYSKEELFARCGASVYFCYEKDEAEATITVTHVRPLSIGDIGDGQHEITFVGKFN